jgi:tetratricopeptide (TPR) repeat protein/transcriptional regulator with XRE-family HTH domain
MKAIAVGGAEFGRLLAGFRLGSGLSQDELARRSGLSVRAVRDLERGQVEHPRRSTIALLADALRLDDTDREALANAAGGLLGRVEERPVAPGTAQQAVPRQLPPDIADFTGRELALEWLHSRLRGSERGSTAVVITAAVGKAGVGKTTLAVHAAHQLRSQFPDGQLYVNLRGVEAQALDPSDVLGRFLRALGVEGHAIPDDVEERADMYRSLMADRCALVLLDNAADEAQVRPLLPAGAGNAVVVTSRTRLAGVAGTEVIDLDVLPPEQAVELLGKIAGADRVSREPAAAQVIASLCGYLPLAVRIAGARLAAKPHWRLQRMAHRLAEHQRLDELTAGDLEVRASVGLSYDGLGETEQRAFRLLGLLEVPDFAPWMLAALLDISVPEAEAVADHLADAQLLDMLGEDAIGQLRYRFHDLVRLYARERLAADESLTTRRAALQRTLQTYFERAWAAVRHLRLRPPELPGATAATFPPDPHGEVAASYQWLATEHTGLAVSLDQAWREGLGGIGQALTRLLADFFEVYACWDEWERTHEAALRAARRAGDRHAEASLLRGLGDLRRFQNRLPEAVDYCTRSNVIFRELGDTGGEVDSLTGLARTYRRQDRLSDAASCFEAALRLCRGLGDPDREAKALLFFAKVRRQQGRFEDALTLLTSCREMFRSVRSCGYVAYSDLMIGIIYSERGEFDRAAEDLAQALTFAQSLGDPRWEGYALLNLAVSARGRGSRAEARRELERSLALFQQAGDGQGTRVASQLLVDLGKASVRRA